jgi:FAD/FMN-containing dehydrogenase/NAD-dependent dihydropyrimidine dehydrogenase PreA subunit
MMNLTEELRRKIGSIRIIDRDEEKEMYSHDIGDIPPFMTKTLFETQPYVVVQPGSAEQIGKVLAFANEKKVPVIPRGAASWGFGGVIPTKAGIVIDLSPFRRVGAVDLERKTVTVEAGARWSDIDIIAKKDGLCLMTYPSSKFSTVGGWISTGGYGINSFRYGHLSEQIESITVAVPTGEIRKLKPADNDFKYFVSAEGMFGIIVEVTLKLREVPKASFPRLLYFTTDEEAFRFIARFVKTMAAEKMAPNVIRFVCGEHLYDMNKILHASVFKEKPAVLIEFSDLVDNEKFTRRTAADDKAEEAPRYIASYLWNERLFGMKTKRLGPTILASEIIISIDKAAAFIGKAKKLGHHFGVEICIDSYILDENRALIMATFLCDSRKLKYSINMPLVSMLTQVAISMGAEPYGLGLWNAPFINYLLNKAKKNELQAFKAKVDPNGIMNPGKFFGVQSKWGNIPAVIFKPAVFGAAMRLLRMIAPVAGRMATLIFGKDEHIDSLDLELSTHACAKCGNCIAVCPAYLVTKDEAVTAKGKVALAKKLFEGKNVTREEAMKVFYCMQCKACQEICQTNLELMMLWDALEKRVEGRFGRPETQIVEFLKEVDDCKEYWEMVERNN